ncbi:MAG: GNAT family N-acetyltransferase [Pseudonocardiaceae bacterium]|nr:GNAT family N-acetyltransferase [Pseudonocardiaceae bacterium]
MVAILSELRTDRLILRPVRADDLPAALEIHTDPRTNLHNPTPHTDQDVPETLEGWLEHWSAHGFGYCAVQLPASGEIIGFGGLRTLHLGDEVALNLYYRFRPSAWGYGYAPEMARAVIEWAQRAVPGTPIVIITSVGNGPAIRVAEKLGFRKFREGDYGGAFSAFFRFP